MRNEKIRNEKNEKMAVGLKHGLGKIFLRRKAIYDKPLQCKVVKMTPLNFRCQNLPTPNIYYKYLTINNNEIL